MAREAKSGAPRVIHYTAKAAADRKENYQHNLKVWGRDQANAYRSFVRDFIRELADNPASAPLVEDFNEVRVAFVRWPGQRAGHRVFFKEIEQGILVLRVLHTARNWQDHMSDE